MFQEIVVVSFLFALCYAAPSPQQLKLNNNLILRLFKRNEDPLQIAESRLISKYTPLRVFRNSLGRFLKAGPMRRFIYKKKKL